MPPRPTAVKYGMNITHVLLNNSQLGKISAEQLAGNWKVWQTSLHNPTFADFARNCGGIWDSRERIHLTAAGVSMRALSGSDGRGSSASAATG